MLTKHPKHGTTDQNYANTSLSQENLDYSLRTEAEKIKKLETEITEALKKLDSYEPTKSKGIGKDEVLKSDIDISRRVNGPNKKDPLRNFKPSE
jgi:uncharacterized protein YlxW (UPF0749 family)